MISLGVILLLLGVIGDASLDSDDKAVNPSLLHYLTDEEVEDYLAEAVTGVDAPPRSHRYRYVIKSSSQQLVTSYQAGAGRSIGKLLVFAKKGKALLYVCVFYS